MPIAGPAVLVGAVAGTLLAGAAYAGIAGGSLAREAAVPPGPVPVVVPTGAATCGEGAQLRDGECVVTVVHSMVPTPVTVGDDSAAAEPSATEPSQEHSEDDDHRGDADEHAEDGDHDEDDAHEDR